MISRTELILLIFADRARTHEGKLQVELAHLQHAQTLVVGGWSHLDRQKGGVGLRGAGETQREMDQRVIGRQIRRVRERLAQVSKRRALSRRRRARERVATVALVGYTNAGKSTLFNALTEARAYAADQLFATLDPTMRAIDIPGVSEVVLADTVGFIRDLPHTLVDAFKATLEEVSGADLLLLVLDASSEQAEEQHSAVVRVLSEIGAHEIPRVLVLNKCDLVSEDAASVVLGPEVDERDCQQVSALTGDGLEALKEQIAARLTAGRQRMEVVLPPEAGRTRAWLYGLGVVAGETVRESGHLALDVTLAPHQRAAVERVPGAVVSPTAG